MSDPKAIHPPPNRASTHAEREQQAGVIRAWLDSIASIQDDAQVYKSSSEYLGSAAMTLTLEADTLWPARAWESSDPPGPPTRTRVDVKVHSRSAWQPGQEQPIVLEISVKEAGKDASEFAIPLRAARPLIEALAQHADYWTRDLAT